MEHLGVKSVRQGSLDICSQPTFCRVLLEFLESSSLWTTTALFHLVWRSADKWSDGFIMCGFPFGLAAVQSALLSVSFHGAVKKLELLPPLIAVTSASHSDGCRV